MRLVGSVLTAAVLAVPGLASARSHRVDDIPNGAVRGCLNCHLTNSGEHFTDFGSDARAHLVGDGLEIRDRSVDWAGVYAKDSDGDTYTNGEELGDPNGTWTIGSPNPPGPTYNPGDEESFPPGVCDNGILQPDEDCDGDLWRATTCAELDLGEGELGCESCLFILSECSLGSGGGSTAGPSPSGGGDDESCAVSSSPGASRGGTSAALWSLLVGLWVLRRKPSTGCRHPRGRIS